MATIVRPRLHSLLDASLRKDMTLIVAPAGYGKSVLLTEWSSTLDIPVAWVPLTEDDNDSGRLVRTIVTAVEGAVEEPMVSIDDRLGLVSPATAPSLIEEWAEQLTAVGEFVLVVDDLHVLIDQSATMAAQRFIEASPSNVHLYIASRHDPPLGTGRLRLEGRLTDMRQDDLAFTIDELSSFLVAGSINIGEDSLHTLHSRTEGWPAALRLAQISMMQTGDPERVVRDLQGTNRIISDYLVEEVLDDMEPEQQQFLLRTSILDDVTPEIAQILTGRVDGAVVLDELAAAGAFTTRASADTFWYHRLLRDVLRARLREMDPELFLDLHRQAASWWWQHGESVTAINHAISAGDTDQATAWLGEASRTLASTGLAATVVELSGRLLDLTAEPSRLLLLTRMWSLYNIMSRPAEVDRILDQLITTISADVAQDTESRDFHGGDPRSFVGTDALPWLRGLQARAIGDVEGLVALDAPAILPSPSGRVEGYAGEGYLWIEQYERAEQLFTTFLEHGSTDQYAPSIVHSTGSLAFALVGQGRLKQADPLLARTAQLIDRFGISSMINCQYAQLVAGWLQWERGELQAAEATFASIQGFVEESGDIPIAVLHALLRSRTRWSLGDRDGARVLLDRAARPTVGRVVTGHFADRITLARVVLDLLDGEPLAAERWIPNWRERLTSGCERERESLALSRLAVALGDSATVDPVLPTARGSASALHHIEALKLAAAVALAGGEGGRAVSSLAAAMREATRAGATQRVVDEAHLFASILDQAAVAAGVASGTFANTHAQPQRSERAPTPPPWFVERLTPREHEVLDQLPTQLNNAEIADLLYVSLHTVKTHVKAIYRKLGVARRTEAVNRAREFGLLPD
jgi:LuxR family maltose regulon positive regulatory protein